MHGSSEPEPSPKSTLPGVITLCVFIQHHSASFEAVPVGQDVTMHGLHRGGPCVSDLRDVRGRSLFYPGSYPPVSLGLLLPPSASRSVFKGLRPNQINHSFNSEFG